MNKLVRNKGLFLSVLCFSIITLALSLSSCGGGGGELTPATPQATDVSGYWDVTAAMSNGTAIPLFYFNLSQSSADVSGLRICDITPVSGFINGIQISLAMDGGDGIHNISLEATVSGDTMSGTWNYSFGGISGTWTATKRSGAPVCWVPWTSQEILNAIEVTNVNSSRTPPVGVMKRWDVPADGIEVNTNGIQRAEQALSYYESNCGGLIKFKRVSGNPTNGIVFTEGDAVNINGEPGCGNADQGSINSAGAISGLSTVHLGSAVCNDAVAGGRPSAYAEHELAHALGLFEHFEGFGIDSGIDNNTYEVACNIYNNPVGASQNNINITIFNIPWPPQ